MNDLIKLKTLRVGLDLDYNLISRLDKIIISEGMIKRKKLLERKLENEIIKMLKNYEPEILGQHFDND